MANQSVLNIVRNACRRIGLVAPSTATGSTDLQIIQLVALLNEDGKELANRYPWTVLQAEKTFVSVAAVDQGLITPTIVAASLGFKYIINESVWNRSRRYPSAGPTQAPRWQAETAFGITGPYSRYRIRGGRLLLLPAPAAGETLAFEYLSENWAITADGLTTKNEFTMDDDVPLLDSDILTQGLVWRFKAAKGLEYAEDFAKYENLAADAKSRDGTKVIASLNGPESANFQPFVTIPLTNWNQ